MDTYRPENIKNLMLKLSGEILAGPAGLGYDANVCDALTGELIAVKDKGYGLAIVLGGGNIFRGGKQPGRNLDRVSMDNIGMLATVQNAIYLSEILIDKGYQAEVFSSFALDKICPLYSASKMRRALAEGSICFAAGGTGNPYFTTDTASVLRAIELKLDIVLKATKVDGLFSADPVKDPSARFIPKASFATCLSEGLKVMDATAFSLALENKMPIKIFNITKQGTLMDAIQKSDVGTYIHP